MPPAVNRFLQGFLEDECNGPCVCLCLMSQALRTLEIHGVFTHVLVL